jgi:hypothetical protein
MPEITPYHVTLRWPHVSGSDIPEIMVNLHAEDGPALEEQLATAGPFVVEHLGKWIVGARAFAAEYDRVPVAPTPIRNVSRANDSHTDEASGGADSAEELPARHEHGATKWARSKNGGLYCAARDGDEPNGFCRWIVDKEGNHRRQPSRAELDDQKRAKRPSEGARRVR